MSNVTAGPGKGEGGRVDLFDVIKFFLQVWDPLIIIEERLIGVNIGLEIEILSIFFLLN